MAYTKTTWTNETSPALNSTNLNKIEQGIQDAHTTADAASAGLAGKANTSHTHTASEIGDSTAVGRSVVTAADAAAARTAISAADSTQGALADTSVQQDGGGSITTITSVTQATYDGLGTPDATTLYVIIPG